MDVIQVHILCIPIPTLFPIPNEDRLEIPTIYLVPKSADIRERKYRDDIIGNIKPSYTFYVRQSGG